MQLHQLFESKETADGAGCVILASDTKRLLFAHRSRTVPQPGTYCTFGGSINRDETALAAMKREVVEETGYNGALKASPLYVFNNENFRYTTFLVVVPHEFTPHLNAENQGYIWCEFGQWPKPLHPGLKALLNDAHSLVLLTHKSLMKKDSVDTSTPAVI